jgi:hypothetical protein
LDYAYDDVLKKTWTLERAMKCINLEKVAFKVGKMPRAEQKLLAFLQFA